tara:strand:- start:1331 stop:1669 length:339 start_codon:yes stop_codon:yes gene_type:complete
MDFRDNLNATTSNQMQVIEYILFRVLSLAASLSLEKLKDNQLRVEKAIRDTDIGMVSPAPVLSFTELQRHRVQERFDTLRGCILDIQGFLQNDTSSEEWEAKKAYIRYLLEK